MTNNDLVNSALAVYDNRTKWTYLQGAIGDKAESDRARGLYDYFWNKPGHGGNSMTRPYKEWLPDMIGKQCTDCSNFINFLLGYTINHYSTWLLSKQRAFEGEIENAPAGTVLCITDGTTCTHVGLCLGCGRFMDFYKYENTCRIASIKGSLFTKAVYLPEITYIIDIDYINADVVSGKVHYIGDEISKDDFVVMASLMDNDEIRVHDFDFQPKQYTNTVNVIAIVYQDKITYITVNAVPIGNFYCVQIPAASQAKALDIQKALTLQGYEGVSVVML